MDNAPSLLLGTLDAIGVPLTRRSPTKSGAVAAASSEEDDYNERYQSLIEHEWATAGSSSSSVEAGLENGLLLQDVVGAFLNAAAETARCIVREYALPLEQKAILPLNLAADAGDGSRPQRGGEHEGDEGAGGPRAPAPGGGAENGSTGGGGEVYLHQGILLRLAEQRKVAGNELRSIGAMQAATLRASRSRCVAGQQSGSAAAGEEQEHVHTVLTCSVDFLGFRFYAMAVPPVDEGRTLAYGRNLPSDPFAAGGAGLRSVLRETARALNLRQHLATARSLADNTLEQVLVELNVDAQLHRCGDRRTYAMNLARLFPLDLPEPGAAEALTNVLRPEFVRAFNVPMSSDAFNASLGDTEDQEQNDMDVAKASQHLREVVIPRLVGHLDSLEEFPLDGAALVRVMHRHGVNVRHLGRIAEMTALPHVRDTAVIEMVARVCKHILNRSLRALARFARDQPGVAGHDKAPGCITDFFNLVLGHGDEASRFWDEVIAPAVVAKFKYVIGDFRDVALHKNQLFWAMQVACGATFVPDDRYAFAAAENPLSTENLRDITPRVSYPENGALACNAMAATAEQHLAKRQYQMAQQGFNLRLGALQALYGRRPGGGCVGGVLSEAPLLLSRLAEVHLGLDDSSTASRCSAEAVRQAPRFHVTSARALETRMRVLFACGDREGALVAYNDAIGAACAHLGHHHPIICELHASLAELYYKDRSMEAALGHMLRAYDLAKKVLGSHHRVVATYSTRLGHIYTAMQVLSTVLSHP